MKVGIDISHHEDVVSFDTVRQSGISFIIAKASEGNFIDHKFLEFWYNINRVNLPRGAYHYYRPLIDNQVQTNTFFAQAGDTSCPPILDVELYRNYFDDVAYYNTTSKETKRRNLKDILDRIEDKFGQKPIIYTGPHFWQTNFSPCTWAQDYKLWLAHYSLYPEPPTDWETFVLHQYSDEGIIPGIIGEVDMNNFFGDEAELYDLFNFVPGDPPIIATGEFKLILVTATELNVRERPTRSSLRVSKVTSGTELVELDERVNSEGVWARIGHNQWIAKVYRGNTYAIYKVI